MKKIFIIVFIFFVFYYNYSNDNTTDIKELSLSEAINISLQKNLNIKNSKIELDNYLLSLQTVWNQFMPNASFGFSFRSNLIDNKINLGLNVNTSLNLNPSSFFNIVKVVNEYKQGFISYEIAVKKFKIEIKKYYYNLIILEKNVKLKELELNNAKIIYNTNLLKYNDGMISIIDKMKSEYTLSEKEIEAKKAKNEYEIALIVFKNIIGLDDKIRIKLITDLPDLNSIEEIKDFSLNNNLELKNVQYDLKNLINTRNSYISQFFPSFNFGYSFSNSFSEPWDNSNYSSSLSLSLSLSLDNLLPFSTLQTNIIKYNKNIEKTENYVEQQKRDKEIELKKKIKELENNKSIIDSYELNVDIAQKTYSIIEKSYLAGVSNYYELKEAEKDLANSNIKIWQARYNYLLTIFDLEYLLNIDIIK